MTRKERSALNKAAWPGRGVGKGPKHGAGWGGPANGEGSKRELTMFTEDNQPDPAAKAEGRREAVADMLEIKALYTTILRDTGEPTPNRISAADKLADRLVGRPKQAIDASFSHDANRLTDEQLAAIAIGSGEAAVGSEADTD